MNGISDGAAPGKLMLTRSLGVLRAVAERGQFNDVGIALASLSGKLAANRCNLAVLGQMKRGKSSFVNALLGAEVLPVGILPLTSVITRVHYGPRPQVTIHYKSGQAEEIAPDRLQEYITEAANPGNRKRVASADVAWPSPLLRTGIDLIDTPGIGSTHEHNTSTTEDYLSEVDAGIIVLSVDPPITAAEADFLRRIRRDIPRLLFVINKTDVATPGEADSIARFLEAELRNRIGIPEPELFAVSARQALEALRRDQQPPPACGMGKIAERLRSFAAEEKEQALLESVAMDVLRIAGTLRFAAGVGERAQALSGAEIADKKTELTRVLARTDQEITDLRHLLRKDAAALVDRIERDLKEHVESSTPAVCRRLTIFRTEHPNETRGRLGQLLDRFVAEEVARVFEDWRVQEDERIRLDLADLSQRFIDRTNLILESLQNAAGTLFEVPVFPFHFRSSLTVESRLCYHTEPIFKFFLDKLVFVLPRVLLRRIVFARMIRSIESELSRNSGRIRYDYLERLEKSVAAFEKEISSSVSLVAGNLRRVLEPTVQTRNASRQTITELDTVMAGCSGLINQRQSRRPAALSCADPVAAVHTEFQ